MVAAPQLKDKPLLEAQKKQGGRDKEGKKARSYSRAVVLVKGAEQNYCRGRPENSSIFLLSPQRQSLMCFIVIFRRTILLKKKI